MDAPAIQIDADVPLRESGLRYVVESLISLALAVMLVRAFAVEGYIISTGSMAPFLLGYHKQVVCPGCGFPFAVGVPVEEGEPTEGPVNCPNCGQAEINLQQVPRNEGDQLLVQKLAYLLRRPRRWEVVVFQNPNRPTQAYVKRVLGLPGEAVRIAAGDVWINGELVRKALSEQRSTRITVCSPAHRPQRDHDLRWEPDPGWRIHDDGFRYSTGYGFSQSPSQSDREDRLRLVSRSVDDSDDEESPTTSGQTSWLAYRGLTKPSQNPKPRETEAARTRSLIWPVDEYGYNGLMDRSTRYLVRDVMVAARVELQRGRGSFSVSMTDGWQTFEVRLSAGRRELELLADGHAKPLDSAKLSGPLWQNPLLIEMSLFDRQLLFALDGQTIFVQKLPVRTNQDGPSRPELNGESPVRLGACDLHVRVHDLTLYRDVYYTRGDGRHGVNEPYRLGPDEYFFLGDNSPISLDSRSWTDAVVRDHMLIGKPFLVHLPSRPGRIKLGSAEWHLRVPDWGRIRYIR